MRKTITHLLVLISSMMLFLSCGTSKSDKNSQSLSIPKNIDMEIPKLLKSDSSKQSKKITRKEEEQSYSYLELKRSIAQLEETKQGFKVDMLLVEQLTDEIADRCQDIPVNTTCTIDENELYFTYSETIIEKIIQLMGEEFREHITKMKNRKIPLGKVEFTRYGELEKYQYLLAIEYVPDAKNITYTKESIKWSKDEKSVVSFYSVTSSEYQNDMELDFKEREDGTKEMSMGGIYSFQYEEDISRYNFKFKIVEKGDEDETFDVVSSTEGNFSNNEEVSVYSDSSIGYISNKGGSLLFIRKYDEQDNEVQERETFDANGETISHTYCDPHLSCDLDDESTWLEYENHAFFIEEDSLETLSSIPNPPPIIELNVIGGNLQDGSYTLLVSETDDSESPVGFIEVNGDDIDAGLFDEEYIEKLDKLVIVRTTFSSDGKGNESISYQIVEERDRPILEVK